MQFALAVLGWLMVAATILPLIQAGAWWIRIFDFPRLQLTLCSLAILLAYVLVMEEPSVADYLLIGALSLCVGYQLVRMYPYTPLAPVQVQLAKASDQTDASLSLFIANVEMNNRRAAVLLDLICEYDPDVILLVETDDWWERALGCLANHYPHQVKCVRNNTYGMMLFSRIELQHAEVRFLIEDDVPSIAAELHPTRDTRIRLRCLHPRPPAPQESDSSVERDAELLLVAKELEDGDAPAIVIGDLNDVAWSRTNNAFQAISGLLDPRIGRGFFSTFNARWPLLRFPLDHVFCSKHFRLLDFEVLRHWGSDHFPMFVRLSLQPAAAHVQQGVPESADDHALADDKIAEATERAGHGQR